MKILKALILGSVVGFSGCTSAFNFSKDFTKKWENNFENRYEYDRKRGKIKKIIEAEGILKNHPTLEDYFYKNEDEDYVEFTDELKDEFGRLFEKAADQTLNQYPFYRRLKRRFRLRFRYGYKNTKKDSKERFIDLLPDNKTWPFVSKNFRIKSGVKLNTKFVDYLDEPFLRAVNPEIYCRLMDMYTLSWYPARNELKQKISYRYGNIEGDINHRFKENFEVEKLGVSLYWFFDKNCALNFEVNNYIRGNKNYQKSNEFSIFFSIKY